MVKEYGELLKDDLEYAEKAAQISALAKDLSEVIVAENLSQLQLSHSSRKVAFHSPCTLQHAQQLSGVVEEVLQRLGFDMARTCDNHLCCGSAGTYSILHPEMSQRLLKEKLSALTVDQPQMIATANIGCQLHLASASELPVSHWIELVEQALDEG